MRINNQWKLIDLDAACVLPHPHSLPLPQPLSRPLSLEPMLGGKESGDGGRNVSINGGGGGAGGSSSAPGGSILAWSTHQSDRIPAGIDTYACRKSSSCYLPPEAIHLDEDTQQARTLTPPRTQPPSYSLPRNPATDSLPRNPATQPLTHSLVTQPPSH